MWSSYVDTYLNGTRDPARHDSATLQEFINNHNVPMQGGGGGGGSYANSGAPWHSPSVQGGFGKGGGMGGDTMEAVARIKAYQKLGPEQKEAWARYAGPTRDPA